MGRKASKYALVLPSICRRWIDALPDCIFAYNISKHESAQETPFRVMFGRDPSPLQPDFIGTLNPIPVTQREDMDQRMRCRQDIIIAQMKRKWDTVNTIVCMPHVIN